MPTVNIPAIAPAYSSGSSGSSCWFNHSLTWAYTVNGPCQACQTLDPSDPNHQRTLCGIQDSGFKLPTLLTTFVADSDSPTPLSRSRGTAILPAEDVWITPMISTPSPTCVTSDPQNVTCSATPLSGTYPIPNPLDNNLAASPFTIAVNVSANAPLGEYVTVTLSQTYNLSTTSTATAAASAPFFITP
ncbi:MAG: hypothetical protein JO061_05350 [Acidobacteriaceae bacterium]|nr:hypothetical protein [Acidobacteriaceae bacterium]